jgi:hypothetical protein
MIPSLIKLRISSILQSFRVPTLWHSETRFWVSTAFPKNCCNLEHCPNAGAGARRKPRPDISRSPSLDTGSISRLCAFHHAKRLKTFGSAARRPGDFDFSLLELPLLPYPKPTGITIDK